MHTLRKLVPHHHPAQPCASLVVARIDANDTAVIEEWTSKLGVAHHDRDAPRKAPDADVETRQIRAALHLARLAQATARLMNRKIDLSLGHGWRDPTWVYRGNTKWRNILTGWTLPRDYATADRSHAQAEAVLRAACRRVAQMPPVERLVSTMLAALNLGMTETAESLDQVAHNAMASIGGVDRLLPKELRLRPLWRLDDETAGQLVSKAAEVLDRCRHAGAPSYTYCAVLVHALRVGLAGQRPSSDVGAPLREHLMGLAARQRRNLVHPVAMLEAFVHTTDSARPGVVAIVVAWLEECKMNQSANAVAMLLHQDLM
ncbi:hypothetical protein [Mollivirus kamchatka]|nr:hypothetical protein [Mollivirus kamchatka]